MKRLLGLDGLRGIAVLAVTIYHAELGIAPGGFLGVDVFFVLSGFLITGLLLNELDSTGALDRANFYLRRMRRLLPALLTVVIATVLYVGFFVPDARFATWRDLPWALSFSLNLSYIFNEQSYFMTMARPPLFQHLWSLAIEEQFYIVWPLVLIAAHKLMRNRTSVRRIVALVSLVGATASTAWMAYYATAHSMPIPNDPSRIYFGTDTHAMGLLIGSALAALWRSERLNPRLTPDRRAAMNLLGIGSLAALIWCFTEMNELTPWLYQYGFVVIALATAGLIIVSAHPGLIFSRLLGNRVLRWFGDRSYGIYIWHWPLFTLMRPGLDQPLPELVTHVLRIVLLLVISDISYRYLELPIRQGAIKSTLQRWHERGIPIPSAFTVTTFVISAALLIGAGSSLAAARQPEPSLLGLAGITAIDDDPVDDPTPIPSASGTAITGVGSDDVYNNHPKPSAGPIDHGKVVVFGDSVVLSGRDALRKYIGKLAIDAKVGRQPSEIAQHINQRRKDGRLTDWVVIHMGTNGIVTRKDLDPILKSLSDRKRVVVVNVQVPRVWMKPTNTMIESIVKKYPNVRLANWKAISKGHRDWFVPDGVHLTFKGGKYFAQEIERALNAP